ncbi:lysophospholipid acyltransferase family protein [bacterium]|nr:lysophospholipid acyltransferase family protein [bacterium]
MSPVKRRFRRACYHRLAVCLSWAVRRLPTGAGRRLCTALVQAGLRLRNRERERARANLRLVFPELADTDRERLLGRSAAALGANLFDALTLDRWHARDYEGVSEDGAMAALRDLRARGRGVLVLTGHFGCWELLGGYLARGLAGLTVVTGTIHNPPVDRLVNDWRRGVGLTPVPREGGLRPLLQCLRGGGVAAVLLDQHTRVENVMVPFCGFPAPTPVGFARLALKLGTPVLPVVIGRRGSGHRVTHLPPLEPGDYVGAGAVEDFLADCNAALETCLRRNPAEWVWFHARWHVASKPGGSEPD